MESFYAVIVGAFISLLGVLITLRWNQKLHENNLREERRKTKEDREFSAKQDALLAAFEALTRFISYYLSLADRILPSDGSTAEEVTEMSVALNRLHFYCNLETIEKSTQLNKVLTVAITDALKAKMESVFIHEELKGIDFQISSLEKWNLSIREEIKAIFQSDPKNSLRPNAQVPSTKIGKNKKFLQLFYSLPNNDLSLPLPVICYLLYAIFCTKRASSPLYRETLFFCASCSLTLSYRYHIYHICCALEQSSSSTILHFNFAL